MHRRILIGAALVPVVLLGIAAVVRPTVEYNSDATSAEAGSWFIAGPVTELLQPSRTLPPTGTAIERRDGKLQWLASSEKGPQIASVNVSSIRLTSGAPLLRSILDDDPTFSAQVEAVVQTSDGKSTALRMTFWDYGLVTPWGLRSSGDGLKPMSVIWD